MAAEGSGDVARPLAARLDVAAVEDTAQDAAEDDDTEAAGTLQLAIAVESAAESAAEAPPDDTSGQAPVAQGA